jgi:hypothetical protein
MVIADFQATKTGWFGRLEHIPIGKDLNRGSDFLGLTDLGKPTEKQIELAAKFGYDISALTKREGNAVIDDLMSQLNYEAIESESLAPSVVVTNVHDSIPQTYVISSIAPDGTVYFRGGNGRKAWARSLRRANTSADDAQ